MTNQEFSDTRTLIDLLVQANELKRQTDYQAAIALYSIAIERWGESADLLGAVAHCYFMVALAQQGTDQDCLDAVAWMEKAVTLEPNNVRLRANLGQFYWLATLDYEKAALAYRKAIEINPNDINALTGAASLYGVPEQVVTLNETINWLERVVQLDPDDPNYHARLGKFYHEAGRVSDARREWLGALLCPQPLDPGYVQMIEAVLSEGNQISPPKTS